MASFDYTLDLERALLKIMTSSQMMCRTYLHVIQPEWFSSAQRKFVLATAQEIFNKSKDILSRMVYEYEVGSKIDATDASHLFPNGI